MLKNKMFIGIVLTLIACLVLLSVGSSPARAEAALNDDFDNATLISGLPFTDSIDTSGSTNAGDDPQVCGWPLRYATVWYSFTPVSDVLVKTDTSGSSYNVSVDVFTGARGSLSPFAYSCQSGSVSFTATAGTTYYIMVSNFDWNSFPEGSYGGSLVFNLSEYPKPANDNFADASIIQELPFSQSADTTSATMEENEPSPSCGSARNTVWYAFTPVNSGSYTLKASGTDSVLLAIYQGTSLTDLEEVGCLQIQWWNIARTIHLEAGTTYYFQESMNGYEWSGWVVDFSLDVAPPINLDFNFWPSDPNIYETIQFNNYSNDPGGASFTSTNWDFGDGASSTDWNTSHRFTQDGDYTVRLDQITEDGRTGSISKQVQVRTHDVVITRFTVPQSAAAGQTRSISVEINNQRYPETVEVQLYKSTQSGWAWVGSLIQYVPIRSSNRTTSFAFSYTFTKDDALLGKINFRAVAVLQGARDAFPLNNEAISLPTKVTR